MTSTASAQTPIQAQAGPAATAPAASTAQPTQSQTGTGSTTASPSLVAAGEAGAPANTTTSRGPPTTAGPTSRSTATPAKRRKKKKKGLAALFAMLGCGGADEFEDEVPGDKGRAGGAGKVNGSGGGNANGNGNGVGGAQKAAQGQGREMAEVDKGKIVPPTKEEAVQPNGNTRTADLNGSKPVESAPTGAAAATSNPALPATPTRNSRDATSSNPAGSGADTALALGSVAAVAGAGTALALEKGRDNLEVRVPTPTKPTAQTETPPLEETEGLTSGAVQPPGSGGQFLHPSHSGHTHHTHTHTTSSHTQGTEISSDLLTDTDDLTSSGGDGTRSEANGDASAGALAGQHQQYQSALAEEDMDVDEEMDEEDRLISQGGIGIPRDADGNLVPLLPPMSSEHTGRKCLVLDLDETLLHSSFKAIPSADYIVPVEIESQTHNVYVIKRPGVDNFLRQMGEIYEVVVFTASLSKYADPVLDMLDVHGVVKHRLFRESCYNHKGNYVKDLSQLGRDMHSCIIIDNSPASYIFHPNNAVPVSTWFNDPHDTELTDLCPFLADLETVDDIRGVLDGSL